MTRMSAGSRKRSRPHSKAAASVASSREVRQRRRAQRKQKFAQQWQRVESAFLSSRRWFPSIQWSGLHLRMPGFSGFHFSKLLSLLLLAAVGFVIYTFQQDETFFVYEDDVSFTGARYLTNAELYDYCDVESWSVLWIDPVLIREQILTHPYVADAQVEVKWPAQITVAIREVEPIAFWTTSVGNFWVLDDGRALPVRSEDSQPSVTIIDPEFTARAPGLGENFYLQGELLQAALTLSSRLPGLDTLRYNRTHGLNFAVPGTNTWIYWGDGRRFEEKWLALESALPDINRNGAANQTFSVIAPNRPYFRYYAAAPGN
ncbi:MAG: FtsQ-type POTRA domain-containing protein [Caldilineaceae bacterium]|nr:FtsQ-type POTRA domain-containing protein [Caldilineaceae bacterium]